MGLVYRNIRKMALGGVTISDELDGIEVAPRSKRGNTGSEKTPVKTPSKPDAIKPDTTTVDKSKGATQDVYNTQKKLKEAGFDPGKLDGIWGPNTQAAFEKMYPGSKKKASPKVSTEEQVSWQDTMKDIKEDNTTPDIPWQDTMKDIKEDVVNKGNNYLSPKQITNIKNNLIMGGKDATDAQVDKDIDFIQTAASCNTKSGGDCARGAYNFNTDYVASRLGVKPIREILQDAVPDIKNSPYSIKSSEDITETPAVHNSGIDTWETAGIIKGTNSGTVLYDSKRDGKDWESYRGNVPIGAIITQGNAKGHYTDVDSDRHTTTVIGYNEDGEALVYDLGQVVTLGQFVIEEYSINKIIIPKGYNKFTYDNIKKSEKYHIDKLGYADIVDKKTYSNDKVDLVQTSMDKYSSDIGLASNISRTTMDKLKDRVVGIGIKESGLGNNIKNGGGIMQVMDDYLLDTDLGNAQVKPYIKGLENDLTSFLSLFNDAPSNPKSDWEVEVSVMKKLRADTSNEGDDSLWNNDGSIDTESTIWKEAYNDERSKVPKRDGGYVNENTSSVGPFKIKNLPESYYRKFGVEKEGLYGSNVPEDLELERGSTASLMHLVESYDLFKVKYSHLNLTDDQLIDLATVAYNNSSKTNSEEFIKNYIVDKKLSDGYLSSILSNIKDYNMSKVDLPNDEMIAMNRKGGIIYR